ncbi:MAG: hypothetical protein K5919_05230 [Clostridiales bacterium]|nr:hypothetical protein [Clostridiales bacterium]
MARFDVSGLDGILTEMARRQQLVGPTADKMLRRGAREVKKAWKRSAVEHGYEKPGKSKRGSGDMIKSIGYKDPKTRGDVRLIEIYPQGKDSKGVRNAMKAFILHYGTSKIRGSRWVDDADRYSEETAIPAMREVWEKENK